MLGFRQFLVIPDPDGSGNLNPTDTNGRFVAMYMGMSPADENTTPAPIRQGSISGCQNGSLARSGTGKGGAAPMMSRSADVDASGGDMILEALLFLPIMFLLIVGMLRIAEITYLYYTLKKTLYATAMYLATQQGSGFLRGQHRPDRGRQELRPDRHHRRFGSTSFLPALTSGSCSISARSATIRLRRLSARAILSGCGSACRVCCSRISSWSRSRPAIRSIRAFPTSSARTIPLLPFVRVPFGGT